MNLENVPGDTLILTIDRKVERGCDACYGQGVWEHEHTMTVTHDMAMDGGDMALEGQPCAGPIEQIICEHCHGTGRRKVRVQGWVEVDTDAGDYADPATICATFEINGEVPTEYVQTYSKNGREIIDAILTAYLDGTLPPEIADNLREVDLDA